MLLLRSTLLCLFLSYASLLHALTPLSEAVTPEDPQISIDADSLNYNQENHVFTAEGTVEIRYLDKILFADRVEYNQKTDHVVAVGHVKLIEASGVTSYADKMHLSEKFSKGVASGFRSEFTNRSHLSATEARRQNMHRLELDDTIYSACTPCKEKDVSLPWQLRAKKTLVNLKEETVTHRNVWLDAFGVPILYSPYFSHPTPGAKPKSGFLLPKYGASKEYGSTLTLPVYFRLSDHADATLTPTFYEKEHPLIHAEYRQRFLHGDTVTTGSIIAPRNTLLLEQNNLPKIRGHLFSKGDFTVRDQWRMGFNLRRSSDQTYLKKFHFSDENFLESQLYARRFMDQQSIGIRALDYQGLRDTDQSSNMPRVLPYFQHHIENDPYSAEDPKLALDSNILAVYRERGIDSRRLSTKLTWTKSALLEGGVLWQWKNALRLDGYHANNVPRVPVAIDNPSSDASNGPASGQYSRYYNGDRARAIPSTQLTLRLPMVAHLGSKSWIIEPITALYASPRRRPNMKIPNEDTVLVELTPENLFQDSPFLGQDLLESGIRTSYGVRSVYFNQEGVGGSMLLGQHYHQKDSQLFAKGSGLDKKFSDYVGQLHLKPDAHIDLLYRVRFSKEDGSIKSNQFTTIFHFHPFSYNMTYTGLFDERQVPNQDVKYLTNTAGIAFKDGWRLEAGSEFNLGQQRAYVENRIVKFFSKLLYQGDCYQLGAVYRRDFIHDRDVVPESYIGININLRTLNYND